MGKKSVSKKSTFEDVVFYNFFKPIYENKNFDVFKDTVDSEQEGCEDYYEKIKNPMYLDLILYKFHEQSYLYLRQIKRDLDLIYQNCIEFNGIENEYIVPIAEQYKQYVEQQYKKVQNLIKENLDWSVEDELLIDPRRIDIGKPILDEDELIRCKIIKSKKSFQDNQQMIKSQDLSSEQINQKQNKRRTTKRSANKQNHIDSNQEIIEESKQQDTLKQSGKTKNKSSKNHHKKYNNKYGLSQDSHDIDEETYSTNNSKKNNAQSQKQSQEHSKKNSQADQKFVKKNKQQQQEEEVNEEEEEEFLNYDLEEMIYNHLLKPIWNKKKFTIFQEPVKTDSPETENYYDVIKNPMCLEQIYDKLDKGEYKKLEQIIQDLNLIADNCTQFNGPENEYTAPLVQEFVNSVEKTFEKVKRMCDKRDIDIKGELKAFNEFTLLTEEEKQKILEEEEKIKEEEKQKELQKLNQQIQNNVSNGNIIHSNSFDMGSEEFNSRRMTRKGSRKDSQVNLQQQNSNSHLNISNNEKQKQSDKKRRNPYKNEDLQQNQLEMEKNIPEKKIRIHETYSEVDIEDYSEVIDSMFLEEEFEEEQEEQENQVQCQEKSNRKIQNQQQEIESQGSENQANQFNQIEKKNKDNIENENCETIKNNLKQKGDLTNEKEQKEINNNSYQNPQKNEKQILAEQNIDQNNCYNNQEIQKITQQIQQNNDMQIQKQQDNDQEIKSENQSLQSTKEQEINGQFQQEFMQLQ